MAAIDTSYQSSGLVADGGAELPRQAVNVSQLSQMENSFLTLMVAQIQNQDPTDPVDSTEFLNQYSAMSQVKSMENMALLAQNNLVLLDNLQTLTAAGLVGQEVTVTVDSVALDGEVLNGQIRLQHASARTVLQLTDSNGVKTKVELGPQTAGTVRFQLDPVKLGLPAGDYKIEVETDSGESPQAELTGLVGNVRVSADGPVLEVEGVGSVPFYKIVEFGRNNAGAATGTA